MFVLSDPSKNFLNLYTALTKQALNSSAYAF